MHPPEDDRSLGERYLAVAGRLRRLSREFWAEQGLTPAQARALTMISHAEDGTLRLGELSVRLRIAPRSVTELVDALEHIGLVERLVDPSDRRATLVTVTAQGARLLRRLRARRVTATDALFGVLSATDRTHLDRILRRLECQP